MGGRETNLQNKHFDLLAHMPKTTKVRVRTGQCWKEAANSNPISNLARGNPSTLAISLHLLRLIPAGN